ncbi:hypothetical protein HKCCE3408_16245 [Rhodobacterales bacterium HKCCE3408]|nr:hypothetical protein [Rhodobacterales bacterium HKCCE3408]
MSATDPLPPKRRRFLERRTYRRNRLEDAARLVPVFGAFLFFGPVLILATGPHDGAGTAVWLVYYLAAWLGLVLVAAGLARSLRAPRPGPDGPEGG